MPGQGPDNSTMRPKYIHPVGISCKAKFVSNNQHPYTGIFKGADNMLIRFSLSIPPTMDPPQVTTSCGFKIFRDHMYSANIFGLYSLEGQTSFNVFEHDLSNHVPHIGPNAVDFLKKLVKFFTEASYYPAFTGVYDAAKYD